MSTTIYSSLSGAKAAWTEMEMVSNNLANATSDGFKAHRLALMSERVSPDELGNSYVKIAETVSDMSDGTLETTGVETHLALRGRGFFVVQGDDGPVMQRSGNFSIDSEGRLVNQRGQRVLTEAGPLEIPDRERMIIDQDGIVRTDQGGEVGRLRLVNTDEAVPIGHGQWRAEGPMAAVNGEIKVIQCSLEKSNVDPMRAMVELMEASRYFESYQKAIQTTDELDGKANDIMRSR